MWSNEQLRPFWAWSQCVGRTPLVQLSENLFGKLEAYNPTGSIKDRVVQFILSRAIKRGELTPDIKVVEATSGNTGISLSAACASLGLELSLIHI